MIEIALLGQIKVRVDGKRVNLNSRPLQLLLAYLMIHVGQTLQRSMLAGVLWPDSSEDAARKNLRNYVWRLRKALGANYITSDKTTVAFIETASYQLDTETLAIGAKASRTETLIEAVSAYKGEFLPGFYRDWVQLERTRLRAIFERQMGTLLEKLTAAADWSELVSWSEHWISFGQIPEQAYRSLMLGHAARGDVARATAAYQRCSKALAEEVGVAPSHETEDLYQQIQKGEILFKAPRQPLTTWVNKFPLADIPDIPNDGLKPTFVGRERELSQLQAALDVATVGQGQVQFVIGGAGRGKTALTAEFVNRAQESDPSLLVISGYCHGHAGITDPYAPFRQVLAQLTGDISAMSGGSLINRELAQRLWAAMPLTIPSLVENAADLINIMVPGEALSRRAAIIFDTDSPLTRQILRILETPFQDSIRQNRLFGQVTSVLKSIAKEIPLLFIIEDLHWIDAASTALLFHLSRAIGDSRILLLGTYRPEEVAIGWDKEKHPLANITAELKRQHGDIWLDLADLSADEGQEFVENYLDTEPNHLDERFRRALFQRTGGHALFTVELIRAMQERGNLVQDNEGYWCLGKDFDWTKLPAKVEGVIEQRFNQLAPDMQSALTIASVEGESFTAEVVARLQQLEDRELVHRLSWEADRRHRLVQVEMQTRSGEQRLSPYHFRHQLFQLYLYQNLNESERTYLHEAVGQALEELHKDHVDQVASQLAWQFERAGLTTKAVDYLVIASRQAARAGANNEVIEYSMRGLKMLQALSPTPQAILNGVILHSSIGFALMATKGYAAPETGESFNRARELCKLAGDTPQLFPVLRGIWAFYLTRGELSDALELAEQQLILTCDQPEASPHLNARWMTGLTLYYMGEFSKAQKQLEHLLGSYHRKTHRTLTLPNSLDLHVSAMLYSASCLWYLGFPDQAAIVSRDALLLARQLAHPLSLAFALSFVSWLKSFNPDDAAILDMAEECIQLSSEYGFVIYQTIGVILQNYARGMRGETEKAIIEIGAGLQTWQATGAQFLIADFLGKLATVYGEAGMGGAGLELVTEALEYSKKSGERNTEPELRLIKGDLLRRVDESAEEIEACFHDSIQVARNQGARMLELRATIHLCRLWLQQGKKDEARTILGEIYDAFSEGFDDPNLIEARILLEELSH
ncbi:MAG: BREX system ATP-binding domain-containing protein [Candidatus Promineifilaceae bacterium]|nr:BREX system ATP-binding domain-containing protein [Candidatus Promineifilaceae bacterium]